MAGDLLRCLLPEEERAGQRTMPGTPRRGRGRGRWQIALPRGHHASSNEIRHEGTMRKQDEHVHPALQASISFSSGVALIRMVAPGKNGLYLVVILKVSDECADTLCASLE